MPKHPQYLNVKYSNQEFEYPYPMTDEEKTLYNRYMFAKQQYEKLVNYLNNTSDYVTVEIDGEKVMANGKTGIILDSGKQPKKLTEEQLENAEKQGYGKGPNGTNLPLTPDMIELLLERSQDLVYACNSLSSFLTQKNGESAKNTEGVVTEESKKRGKLLFEVKFSQKNAQQDTSAIEFMDEGEEMSYKNLHGSASNVVIDLGNTAPNIAKGQLSSRMKLCYVDKNGKINKGFFTENTYISVTKYQQLDMLLEYVPSLEPIIPYIRNNPDYKSIDALISWDKNYSVYGDDFDKSFRKSLKDDFGVPEEVLNDFKHTFGKSEHANLVDLHKNINLIKSNERWPAKNEFTDYTTMEQRNVAMSDVASLFGLEKSIAKSVPMEIQRNGNIIHGCFMKKANGMEIKDINPRNPFFHGKEIKIDYNSVGKSNANMMVLDYICGNADRHWKNMFYQFVKDKDGNPTLVGFQGIDNDFSFTNVVPKEKERYDKLAPLTEIKSLPSDTFDRIKNTSEESLRATLGGFQLSFEEVDACVKRFNKVKERIVKGKIQRKDTFDKKDFEYYSKNVNKDLGLGCTPIRNFMHRMKGTQNEPGYETILENDKKKNTYSEEYFSKRERELNRVKTEEGIASLQSKIYMDETLSIKTQAKNIGKMVGKLWSPTEKDVPEYEEMYNAMKKLQKTMKEISPKGKILSDEDANKLHLRYNAVYDSIKKYLPAIAANPTKNDRKRMNIAETVMDLCIVGIQDRERQVNQMNEIFSLTMKNLTDISKKYEEAKNSATTDKHDFAVLEAEYESKKELSAVVGGLDLVDTGNDKYMQSLAKLCVAYEIPRLKKDSPKTYGQILRKMDKHAENNENYIDTLAKTLLASKNFKKLAGNFNPTAVLTPRVQKYLENQLQTFNLLETTLVMNNARNMQQKKENGRTQNIVKT